MYKKLSLFLASILLVMLPTSVAAQSDLSQTLGNWKDEAQKRRQQNREKYDPDHIKVSLEDWISLNTRALEYIMDQPLTSAERKRAVAELITEHKGKSGRLHRSAQFYRTFFDRIETSENVFLKQAYARRMYSHLYHHYPAENRARSPFFQILAENDPVVADDPVSMTLVTRRDLIAAHAFVRSHSKNLWFDKVSKSAIDNGVPTFESQYNALKQKRCTYGVRGASLLMPLASTASENWSNLKPADRKKLAAFVKGGPFPKALITQLTSLDGKAAFYGAAGASNLDANEQRLIDSAANATAFIQNDPSTSLGITIPAISAAYAKQMAKCSG